MSANPIQKRFVKLMQKSLAVVENIMQNVSQEDATTYRDSGDGWTVVEVLCHLRDANDIFHKRAAMMVEQTNPDLPVFDHDGMVTALKYNEQDAQAVLAELKASREAIIAFYKGLSAEQWQATGTHPESGAFNMTASVAQVGTHEVDHIEQITRILAEKR